MSHGFGKRSVKKHCLRVNEQGFISLYAMLLLLIFLCFVTLLVQRAAAYAAVRGLQESYDLFAIHNCRRYLQETLKPDADAEADMKERKGEESETGEEPQKEEQPKEWEVLFRNTYFHFTKEEEHIAVTYTQKSNTVHMQIFFDRTDGTVPYRTLYIYSSVNHTNKEVVYMLTIGLSTLLFLAFAGLGNLLLIMNETAYMLVPLYAVLLLFGRLFYREANCKALEGKDFLLTLVIVLLFLGYFEWRQELFDFTTFWYLYLTTFIAFMLYADSIRFKSLM